MKILIRLKRKARISAYVLGLSGFSVSWLLALLGDRIGYLVSNKSFQGGEWSVDLLPPFGMPSRYSPFSLH
ncbi:MAG: hypothetical protein KBT87_14390 [Gammaproteobacteria bacterium]|nr:hypothetical protein [Gammaproteobacteria bacterium]MBQ0775859.1 hypothetical protein [Gammaproteobacteria bacterium]